MATGPAPGLCWGTERPGPFRGIGTTPQGCGGELRDWGCIEGLELSQDCGGELEPRSFQKDLDFSRALLRNTGTDPFRVFQSSVLGPWVPMGGTMKLPHKAVPEAVVVLNDLRLPL